MVVVGGGGWIEDLGFSYTAIPGFSRIFEEKPGIFLGFSMGYPGFSMGYPGFSLDYPGFS